MSTKEGQTKDDSKEKKLDSADINSRKNQRGGKSNPKKANQRNANQSNNDGQAVPSTASSRQDSSKGKSSSEKETQPTRKAFHNNSNNQAQQSNQMKNVNEMKSTSKNGSFRRNENKPFSQNSRKEPNTKQCVSEENIFDQTIPEKYLLTQKSSDNVNTHKEPIKPILINEETPPKSTIPDKFLLNSGNSMANSFNAPTKQNFNRGKNPSGTIPENFLQNQRRDFRVNPFKQPTKQHFIPEEKSNINHLRAPRNSTDRAVSNNVQGNLVRDSNHINPFKQPTKQHFIPEESSNINHFKPRNSTNRAVSNNVQENSNQINPFKQPTKQHFLSEEKSNVNHFEPPRNSAVSNNVQGNSNRLTWRNPSNQSQTHDNNRNFQHQSHRNQNNRITDEEFGSLFHVKKVFTKQPDWILPNVSKAYSSQPYEFDHFQEQKAEMNRVKDGILENYPYEKWRLVQNKFGLVSMIVKVLKFNFKLGHVVRNWPKAYEIFSSYPLVISGKLNSVHIGDQHGGMIVALNHYLHSNFEDVQWNWKATAENPYYEDGPKANRMDDRLVCNTYKNWSFGVDFSGDMIEKENIDFFVKSCQELNEVNLAIVNSTIDTKLDPHNKEQWVFDHHFSGLVAALKLLSKGGNLILISFSMFNAVNISLMYFLNLVFENVHMFKPLTSPMTSFEFYIIGVNFRKDANVESYIEEMKSRVGLNSWEKAPIFPRNEIPKSFLTQHEEYMKYFKETYIINMKKFKFYNENPDAQQTDRWMRIIRLMPNKFIDKLKIENIPAPKKLITHHANTVLCAGMSKLKVDCIFNLNENCNLAVDTLKSFDDKEISEQLLLIFEKFQGTQQLLTWPYDSESKTLSNLQPVNLVLEYGKPIERVRKTMFITPVSLYCFVANIEEKYDLFVVKHFPQEDICCVFDEKTVIPYKFNENHGQSERDFLRKVFKMWMDLKPKKVVFKNVLFLTHFSTSVLRAIASFYKFFSVNLKGTVEVEQLKPDLKDSKYIQDFWEELNGSSFDYIMCFSEFKHVNKGEFFEIITNYNSQLMMQYIVKTLDYLIAKNM